MADVALVMSNPGVGGCVSNQCDAAMLARARSKCMVARLGVQEPGKGLDAIRYDAVQVLAWVQSTCVGMQTATNTLARHSGPDPRVLTEYGKVRVYGGGSRRIARMDA